ncbi:heme exporter protein CcmD [Amylibacter sp. IMCC11727]|uniref:heme exporter protein CcmD n=1 Tax=Amylibacter sp. IMCC11727 TaxID=3039851 RepID=UPI00244DEF2E|nr:heme exporter protein CcmD [Amylibacter sp. IMCC11727]WGI20226.1 heme exporter protein CcmD [Amylibacter sp. IMCC11727]
MIPDLGKYAADVLSAYAVALLLLVGLVVLSVRQAAKARAALTQAEQQDKT